MTEDSIRKELQDLKLQVHDNGATSKNIEKILKDFKEQIEKACVAISTEKDDRVKGDAGIKDHFNVRFINMYIALIGFLGSSLVGLIIWEATRKGS